MDSGKGHPNTRRFAQIMCFRLARKLVRLFTISRYAYNNNYQSTLGMTPFQALYDRSCRSPTCWLDNKDLVFDGLDMIDDTINVVDLIRKRLKEAQYPKNPMQICSKGT